jgi:hypothetical protein
MKLARPDVFHPRIVLAGDGSHPDDAGLVAALRHRGLHARWLAWDDPQTSAADLVVLRSAPAGRRGEFLAWTRQVPHLLNPPGAVAWNLDERYLRDLAGAGVPTAPGERAEAALIFLGGQRSHAWPVEPDFEAWDLGRAALTAAAAHSGVKPGELLYARADVTSDARLVGLDLVAPELGWGRLDAETRELAQRRFALATESACERLGLGPLSHRRP